MPRDRWALQWNMSYAFYPNLEAEVQIPENGILSAPFTTDDSSES